MASASCPEARARTTSRRPTGGRATSAGWRPGALPDGYAVDQHVALQFENGVLVGAVAEREGHAAYRVERRADTVVETELAVRLLA